MIIEYNIKDKNGRSIEIGDKVRVDLPEVPSGNDFEADGFGFPGFDACTIEAIVGHRLSSGINLKITKVIPVYPEDFDAFNVRVAQVIPFRRCAWEWEKI